MKKESPVYYHNTENDFRDWDWGDKLTRADLVIAPGSALATLFLFGTFPALGLAEAGVAMTYIAIRMARNSGFLKLGKE